MSSGNSDVAFLAKGVRIWIQWEIVSTLGAALLVAGLCVTGFVFGHDAAVNYMVGVVVLGAVSFVAFFVIACLMALRSLFS